MSINNNTITMRSLSYLYAILNPLYIAIHQRTISWTSGVGSGGGGGGEGAAFYLGGPEYPSDPLKNPPGNL